MRKNEVKLGALLSYVIIFANTFYGLILAPYMLGKLGNSEYGVYKTIAGMTGMISVLEMGMGSTMQRFIARMNAEGRRDRSENISAMGLIQVWILVPVMLAVGLILYPTLEKAFPAFTPSEVQKAKELFALMVVQVILHMFENFYFGVIAGYNRFVFSNCLKLTSLFLRIMLYFVLLPLIPNAVTVVGISIFLEITVILIEILYIRLRLDHRIKLTKWEKGLFRDTFAYTVLLFIQSLIVQFNGRVDSLVIASVIGSGAVALYSFALQIFNMYETCATSISGVLLPTVTKKIVDGADGKDLEGLVVKYGRAQWMFLGGALFGILCCGKEFFRLWLWEDFGEKTLHCWILCLILSIPVTFPLITNTCLTILKARNDLRFRTWCLAGSAILNIILTYFGTLRWGYWAAAVGTAASTFVGSIIVMNIYYHKKLNMRMLWVYRNIFRGITPALLLASLSAILLNAIMGGSWLLFIVKVAVFLLVYGLCLLTFGLNKEERRGIPFITKKG